MVDGAHSRQRWDADGIAKEALAQAESVVALSQTPVAHASSQLEPFEADVSIAMEKFALSRSGAVPARVRMRNAPG